MSQDGTDSGNKTIPTWVTEIGAGGGATLATIAADPEEFIREIIAEWVVGGIFEGTQYVLGWVLFGADRTALILLDVIPIIGDGMELNERVVTDAVGAFFGVFQSIALSAGLAGPPAAALAVGLMVLVVGAVLYGLLKVIPGSDFFEGTLEGLTK